MYVFNLFQTVYVLTLLDGLPSIVELLRVTINILDPADQMHTDSTRLTALGILNTMFDVAGPRMGDFPSLIALVIDHGCKYLFQLARSDNPAILNLSLRTISTMFETMRSHLKLQQELFLAFTIDRLAPPIPPSSVRKGVLTPTPGTPSNASPLLTATDISPESRKSVATPRPPVVPAPARGETREIMLETLNQISRNPSFMVDLYVNYDCDPNCDNMFERLIEFLTQVGICVLSPSPS
jgi:brefeldin A-resistance guanine nucleotide exchange factor 1